MKFAAIVVALLAASPAVAGYNQFHGTWFSGDAGQCARKANNLPALFVDEGGFVFDGEYQCTITSGANATCGFGDSEPDVATIKVERRGDALTVILNGEKNTYTRCPN